MAKRRDKSLAGRVARSLRRDMGPAWNGDFVALLEGIARSYSEGFDAEGLEHAGLLGDRWLSLTDEGMVRDMDEAARPEGDETPCIYPELIRSWQTRGRSLTLPPEADLADGSLLDVPLSALSSLFPACLLVDVSAQRLSIAERWPVDAFFCYPTYDGRLDAVCLMVVALDEAHGVGWAFEAKVLLEGETFGEALARTEEARLESRRAAFAGFKSHVSWDRLHPDEEDPEAGLLAALALAWLARGAEPAQAPAEPEPTPRAATRLPADAAPETEPEPGPAAEGPEPEPASEPGPASPEPDGAGGDGAEDAAGRAPDAGAELSRALDRVAELEWRVTSLARENERLRASAAAREGLAETLSRLELPRTPAEALAAAEALFPDRLLVLDSAKRSAEEYRGDAGEVWAVLRDMACVLQPLAAPGQAAHLSREFQDRCGWELALRDVKHEKANAGLSSQRRFAYKGSERDATPHVKGRGSKRGQTLRVHFFFDHEEGLVVVAHCGEHMESHRTGKV